MLFEAQEDDNIYNKLGYKLCERLGFTATDSIAAENYKDKILEFFQVSSASTVLIDQKTE